VGAVVLKNGGIILDVPVLIDSLAFHDLENPMIRAVRECRISGRSFIEHAPGTTVHSLTADEVSEFIQKQLEGETHRRPARSALCGNTNMTIPEAVKLAVSAAGFEPCNLSFAEYPHQIQKLPRTAPQTTIGRPDANATAMIMRSFCNFSRPEQETPYFSIVMVGRHDNFSKGFERRAQHSLDAIDSHLATVPLAKVELVFVDYATPIANATLLHRVLTVGPHLTGKLRYVIVPEEAHRRLVTRMNGTISFLEYVAKNIGIRRARGEFILTTNPDDLFSVQLFELIAAQEFNPALFYRAQRWDNRDTTVYPINELVRGLSEPWEMRNWDVNQRCPVQVPRFAIIDSLKAFDRKIFPCGCGDFVLMSKRMWDAVEGFHEFPANPNVDFVFLGRMMKFVPGFVQMIMYPLILHQRHVKRNVFRPSVLNTTEMVNEYACKGTCTLCGRFAETVDWGLANDYFEEIIV
jgi:hypothetical protein